MLRRTGRSARELRVTDSEVNMRIVQKFWDALAARDWHGMKALLTGDAHYTDVGVPGPGGRGPDGVLARLMLDAPAWWLEHIAAGMS